MRYNVNEAKWTTIKLKNKLCLFTDFRINRNSVPEGFNMYEVAGCSGTPSYIAKGILVNFFGTIITKEEFEFTDRYYDFNKNEWKYQLNNRYYNLDKLLLDFK